LNTTMPIRIVYRSKKVSVPLIAAIEACGGWERAGIDVQRMDFVNGAAQSDPLLISGEIDFIFGSHISPYIHKSKGLDFVCLGSTVNWVNDSLVSKQPIEDLGELRGKVIATDSVSTSNHPWANHKLYMMRAGVDSSEITWVGGKSSGTKRKSWELVASGEADAAMVIPPNHKNAAKAGLVVRQMPLLPMVQSTTLTTLWKTRNERTDLCRGVVRAVRDGIKFFKEEREQMLKLMFGEVADKLEVTNEETLVDLYEQNCGLLESRLYPTPEAIANAYRLAVLQDPSIQGRVSPLELWDTELLREADAADELAV
jgi:ABC-type nitrate/sulfonate/bicarbonate transport system substrate-binding protein